MTSLANTGSAYLTCEEKITVKDQPPMNISSFLSAVALLVLMQSCRSIAKLDWHLEKSAETVGLQVI